MHSIFGRCGVTIDSDVARATEESRNRPQHDRARNPRIFRHIPALKCSLDSARVRSFRSDRVTEDLRLLTTLYTRTSKQGSNDWLLLQPYSSLAAGQDGCCLSLVRNCCGGNAVDNEYGLRTDAYAEHQILPAQQQKLRILLVDDSADYVTAICAVLEEKGIIEVIGAAGNGIEAIEAVADLQPDLVIWMCRRLKWTG